jgi:peptidoglycan-associated lipoprotein
MPLEDVEMLRKLVIVAAGAALLALHGCGGKSAVKANAGGAAGSAPAAASAGNAEGAGVAANAGTVGEGGAAGRSAPAGVARLIYFDFDSAEIRPEFIAVIAAHAHALAANASIRVRLEGHTDERGSPEYNIGLGERRAQSVRRALLLQGVGEAQVATVSYGNQRPAVAGQGEEAWAKNRRVEFVYLN